MGNFLKKLIGIASVGGLGRQPDPPPSSLVLHPLQNDPESIELMNARIDAIIKDRESLRKHEEMRLRHDMFRRLFNILLIFIVISGGWSFYVIAFGDGAKLQIAQWVFSTLLSAAVASFIGFMATWPANER